MPSGAACGRVVEGGHSRVRADARLRESRRLPRVLTQVQLTRVPMQLPAGGKSCFSNDASAHPIGPAVLPGAVIFSYFFSFFSFRTQLDAPGEQQRLRVPTRLPVPCKDAHRRMRC